MPVSEKTTPSPRPTSSTDSFPPTSAQRAPSPSLRRLFPYARPALRRIVIGGLCALGASLAALAIPQALERVVNGPLLDAAADGVTASERSALAWWMAVILGLGVVEAAFIYLRRALILGPSTVVEFDMRTALFRHLQNLPVAFHDQWPGGQLLSRAIGDLGLLRRWLAFGMVALTVNVATIGVGVALMVRMGGPLGLVYLAGAIPVIALSFHYSRRYRRISRLSQDQQGDLATSVEESVHGIRVLKAFGRGRHALSAFSRQADTLRSTEIEKARTLSSVTFWLTTVPELVLGVVLIWGIARVADGETTVGGLVAFFATAAVMMGPVEQVGSLMAMTLTARTALDRHFEVMDTPNAVADPVRPRPIARDAEGLAAGSGELAFDDVHFAYPAAASGSERRSEVLRGVDLTVRPGETMALVGLTGSGKTTLAMLVPRLYDVCAGAVRVDGVDVRDLTRQDLRSVVAVAFEDATLFSDTVRENVLLGAPDTRRSDDDLERAIGVAQADFVHRLPDGVDTRIGEEGMSLSGGQRQRLALARAIAARPRILVLDDPLSALDVETEERVEEALRREVSGITTLVVAHRPSTVALADRVAVLHDGRITGVGVHSELMATHPHYRHVISSLEEHDRMTTEARA